MPTQLRCPICDFVSVHRFGLTPYFGDHLGDVPSLIVLRIGSEALSACGLYTLYPSLKRAPARDEFERFAIIIRVASKDRT
jgi:hypothetical protein